VTEIGNSAINPPGEQTANQQAAIDFEVVLTLAASDAPLRPDLSATADNVVESRRKAVSVPIIAMTVRDAEDVSGDADGDGDEDGDAGAPDPSVNGETDEHSDVEGVFVVRDGTVTFRAVEIGIAGAEYFEVLSGLSVGDTVVAGPYQRIRQLRNGDDVRLMGADDPDSGEDEG